MTDSAFTDPRPSVSIVIPTVGRPTLSRLLDLLLPQLREDVTDVVIVDDRAAPATTAELSAAVGRLIARAAFAPHSATGAVTAEPAAPRVRVVGGPGRGPAAARNAGWRLARGEWVAFLDDDVEAPADWLARLLDDLQNLPSDVGGSQGRIVVPLPGDHRPTDWERSTAGLESAAWATADMAYRRDMLARLGGFDERFPRAFREDADLALRALRSGARLVRGGRVIRHPVRPAGRWVSVRSQAGNADDALMRRLHGSDWHASADAPRGRIVRHAAITAAGLGGLVAAAAGRRDAAAGAAGMWLAGVAEFAAARIAGGPHTPGEVATMLATSVVIPPLAVWQRLRGEWQWRRGAAQWPVTVKAVLFDRDGTLVHDVAYNGDPDQVRPMPGAGAALERLRTAGLQVGVISNQSGVGRGLLTPAEVAAVNERIERLLGPFDTWQICPHGPESGCACRKPQPGLVLGAARELGVEPWECAVIGDIGSDVEAAIRAGARAVLVPTPVTRPEEVAAAPAVAADLAQAVDLLLDPAGAGSVAGETRRPSGIRLTDEPAPGHRPADRDDGVPAGAGSLA